MEIAQAVAFTTLYSFREVSDARTVHTEHGTATSAMPNEWLQRESWWLLQAVQAHMCEAACQFGDVTTGGCCRKKIL